MALTATYLLVNTLDGAGLKNNMHSCTPLRYKQSRLETPPSQILSHAVQLETVQFNSRNSWKQSKIAL